MSDKGVPLSKGYVYAFTAGRLVLLVCMVIALMALSLMLGIRIERYQRSSEIVAREQRVPMPPTVEPAERIPEAAVESTGAGKTTSPPPQQVKPAAAPAKPQEPPPAKPSPAPDTKQAKSEAEVKPEPQEAGSQKQAPTTRKPVPTRHYAVQVSSSQDRSMASSQVEFLKRKGFDSYLEEIDLGERGRFFRVMVGPFVSKKEANRVREQLLEDSRFEGSYIRYLP